MPPSPTSTAGDVDLLRPGIPLAGAAERRQLAALCFQSKMVELTEPVSNVMYRTQKRWGEIDDSDMVWRAHFFAANDPPAFAAALDESMSSETGKGFPGQVFLSSVVSGGMSPVTHVISVGQASEAESEAWEGKLQGSADWAKYLEASRDAADYLVNNMVRTVKTWGKSLDEVTR